MPTLSVRILLASLLTLLVFTLLAVPLHRQPIVSGQTPLSYGNTTSPPDPLSNRRGGENTVFKALSHGRGVWGEVNHDGARLRNIKYPTGLARLRRDDPSALTPLELAQIAEIRHVLTTYAADVWPGWETHLPPLLIRKGDFDYLIGHPDPPAEFEAVLDLQLDGEPVWRMDGHLTPAPVATAWPVGDVWAATTPVRDEFQAAVDDLLGEGVVVLDDVAFIRAVVHEAFHAYQMNAYGGPEHLPEFALTGDLAWLDTLTDEERLALDTALVAEGQALNEALSEDATEAEIHAAIDMFLSLRAERRANLPDEATAFERSVEWTEGAARYSDTRLMLLAGSADYVPSHEAAAVELAYPSSAAVWAHFRAQLADVLTIPGGYRDRFYVLGAAQLFILDRLTNDWQSRLWDEGAAVEDLLAEYASGSDTFSEDARKLYLTPTPLPWAEGATVAKRGAKGQTLR
ncbi:MAG: hypothetical protein K8L91_02110 [Anaerolineae bacterium]|nr:hypothetical protein [Anaerolineae bacterium]